MNWKEARELSGMTQDAVWIAWNTRDMPAEVRRELSRNKLQRLEHGGSARLTSTAKAYLADVLGFPLGAIDLVAAESYRELTQAKPLSTWMNASDGATAADIEDEAARDLADPLPATRVAQQQLTPAAA